jgi:SAM-dependent methyltransferase
MPIVIPTINVPSVTANRPITTPFESVILCDATDVGPAQLAEIPDLVSRERLENVTVIEGARNSTNLPDGCCDAIFMRDVYHHLTQPKEINDSLLAALKPGGRLAIMDFEPEPISNPTRAPHAMTGSL